MWQIFLCCKDLANIRNNALFGSPHSLFALDTVFSVPYLLYILLCFVHFYAWHMSIFLFWRTFQSFLPTFHTWILVCFFLFFIPGIGIATFRHMSKQETTFVCSLSQTRHFHATPSSPLCSFNTLSQQWYSRRVIFPFCSVLLISRQSCKILSTFTQKAKNGRNNMVEHNAPTMSGSGIFS